MFGFGYALIDFKEFYFFVSVRFQGICEMALNLKVLGCVVLECLRVFMLNLIFCIEHEIFLTAHKYLLAG